MFLFLPQRVLVSLSGEVHNVKCDAVPYVVREVNKILKPASKGKTIRLWKGKASLSKKYRPMHLLKSLMA